MPMVYVVEPSSEYPYFIFGHWVDFETKVPDLDKRAEVSSIFMTGKRYLSHSEVPEVLRLTRHYKKLSDIFKTHGGAVVVSQRLRNQIEHLDPGRHLFFPVRIDNFDDGISRFLLNVYVKQDSIVDEQSNVRSISIKAPDSRLMSLVFHSTRDKTIPADGEVDVTFDGKALGDSYLWRELRYPNNLFVSDTFVGALNQQKLNFFKLRRGRDL